MEHGVDPGQRAVQQVRIPNVAFEELDPLRQGRLIVRMDLRHQAVEYAHLRSGRQQLRAEMAAYETRAASDEIGERHSEPRRLPARQRV
jgi:hypothetical protein